MAIQFEEARKKVDPQFAAAAKELSDAYYNYWRKGVSHPWGGFDLLSKEEFDKVHGALWHLYDRALVQEIERGSYGYDREKYDPIIDEETQKRRSEETVERLTALAAADRSTSDRLIAAIDAKANIKTER